MIVQLIPILILNKHYIKHANIFQLIGLTATVGIGSGGSQKKANQMTAKEHALTLCSRLDLKLPPTQLVDNQLPLVARATGILQNFKLLSFISFTYYTMVGMHASQQIKRPCCLIKQPKLSRVSLFSLPAYWFSGSSLVE